jgi:hypothetical protein
VGVGGADVERMVAGAKVVQLLGGEARGLSNVARIDLAPEAG